MELSGRKIWVAGLGNTGRAVVRFLKHHGASVLVSDNRAREVLSDAIAEAESLGVRVMDQSSLTKLPADIDLVVVSPGIPWLPFLEDAKRRGIEIISEVELAGRFLKAPVIGVTGTNGKSTVVTALGQLLARCDRPTFVGGNLGTPLIEAVGSAADQPDGIVVAELSSYQLEHVEQLRVHVGAILNITPDHLDRYASMADYAYAKAQIFRGQTARDFAVLPAADELVRRYGRFVPSRLVLFGGQDGDVRFEGDALIDTLRGQRWAIREISPALRIHRDNTACIALIAGLCGVDAATIGAVLRDFKGLPHRTQHVGAVGGIDFIDDSKATNVAATVASVTSVAELGGKVVLIAGGKDKGGGYDAMRDVLRNHGRALVVIGEAARLIEASCRGACPIQCASDMVEAVTLAAAAAHEGDHVLLAPACSSFDMFRSYAERGDIFQRAVAQYVASHSAQRTTSPSHVGETLATAKGDRHGV